ncbi:hypothetical protein D3C87_1491790 [compost metagenome]
MAGHRHDLRIVDEFECRRDAGLRIGSVVERHRFDFIGIACGICLFDREQKTVARSEPLLRIAAADRTDEAQLDVRLVLGARRYRKQGRRHHQAGQKRAPAHSQFLHSFTLLLLFGLVVSAGFPELFPSWPRLKAAG